MSQLLEQAIAEARKLPADEQEVLAAISLAEIEDERRWDEVLTRSPGKLDALVARAQQQVHEGRCRVTGFDKL